MGRLTVLKQIAADLASQFGPDCEVVIHDLKTSEPEHSIVYIVNGHVTNRDIGDGPSNAVFDAIRNQEKGATPEDHTGYLMKTADGKSAALPTFMMTMVPFIMFSESIMTLPSLL